MGVVIDCGLWGIGLFLLKGIAKVLDINGNCTLLLYLLI